MRRIAFFVEGYSEVAFIEKLIEEIAGRNNVQIEKGYIKGGKTIPKQLIMLSGTGVATGCEYYVLILNCQGDHQVATRIREEHSSFSQNGYEKIIGVRDVRPDFGYADIPLLKKTMRKLFDPNLIPVEIVLSVMEIESVFLGEATHFPKIDPNITVDSIINNLGFNPETDDLQLRAEPAKDMENCYALGGKTYEKSSVQDTVNALDFDRIYIDLQARFGSVAQLVSNIDRFLTPLTA